MIALVLVTHSSVELLAVQAPKGLVLGYASNISIGDVLQQTNQQRLNAGLPPLQLNDKLNQAAAGKASDMFGQDYWAHISPSGIPPWTFIKNAGYRYTVAGENLARDFDTTGPMVDAWMASPTHKANVVHRKYTETGIAVANGRLGGIETTLVVQMFGTPVQPILANPSENIVPEPPAEADTIEEITAEVSIPEVETPVPFETATIESAPSVLSQTETTDPSEDRNTWVSPLDVKKSAVLSIILLIMTVLVLDEVIIRRRQTVRFVGRNAAHISFLMLVLLIIWNVVQPGIIQ